MGAIVWLASYPKSGNTWCRAFLNNLLRNPDKPVNINDLDQFSLGESSGAWYRDLIDKPLLEYSRAELAAMRPYAQERLTRVSPDSVFVKTHNLLGVWHGQPLHNMNVTVAAIYIVRNPLDVVLSMTSHFGLTIDQAIYRLADPQAITGTDEGHVPEIHGNWSDHVLSWTGDKHAQMLVLRYEDMLNKPMPTFTTMAKFLGLNPPKERIRKAIKFASFKELKKQEEEGDFKERSKRADSFFRKGRAGQWKSDLTEDQIAHIIDDHHVQMARFKYLPKDWEERVAAWKRRINSGRAESREAFSVRVLHELSQRDSERDPVNIKAGRQAESDQAGAVGMLPQPGA